MFVGKKKSKGRFYIAQYPVRWTAQRALHFVSISLLFPKTNNAISQSS